MTEAAVIQGFMSSFGVPAYTSASVPDDAGFPYLTYELSISDWGDFPTSLAVNLWYRGSDDGSSANVLANAKVAEIKNFLSHGGVQLTCDSGTIWIKRGAPFSQSMGDPSDGEIRRRYILLDVEYNTTL